MAASPGAVGVRQTTVRFKISPFKISPPIAELGPPDSFPSTHQRSSPRGHPIEPTVPRASGPLPREPSLRATPYVSRAQEAPPRLPCGQLSRAEASARAERSNQLLQVSKTDESALKSAIPVENQTPVVCTTIRSTSSTDGTSSAERPFPAELRRHGCCTYLLREFCHSFLQLGLKSYCSCMLCESPAYHDEAPPTSGADPPPSNGGAAELLRIGNPFWAQVGWLLRHKFDGNPARQGAELRSAFLSQTREPSLLAGLLIVVAALFIASGTEEVDGERDTLQQLHIGFMFVSAMLNAAGMLQAVYLRSVALAIPAECFFDYLAHRGHKCLNSPHERYFWGMLLLLIGLVLGVYAYHSRPLGHMCAAIASLTFVVTQLDKAFEGVKFETYLQCALRQMKEPCVARGHSR